METLCSGVLEWIETSFCSRWKKTCECLRIRPHLDVGLEIWLYPPLAPSLLVCHQDSTESSRDDIISLSSFLHIVPCLFLLKSKERKPWQIFATLWCAAHRGAAIDKVHWICFSWNFTNFVKMCRNLVKSGKKCEAGEIYEVLEITVRTKSSCWQCARNFCISRCCPTVTWLSSLLYFLRFNWCNENVFFVDHLLQCRSCTARLSNSYEIQIKRSAHTGSLGNVNNKKTLLFFAFFYV